MAIVKFMMIGSMADRVGQGLSKVKTSGTDPGAILIYEPLVRITGEFLLMLNGLRDLTWSGDSDLIYEPAVRIIMESFVEYEGLATVEKW